MAQHKNNIYLILIAFIFFGCKEVNTNRGNRGNSGFVISEGTSPLQLVEIDSCEYFFGEWGSNSTTVLTHKGNCKFCKQRKPKLK